MVRKGLNVTNAFTFSNDISRHNCQNTICEGQSFNTHTKYSIFDQACNVFSDEYNICIYNIPFVNPIIHYDAVMTILFSPSQSRSLEFPCLHLKFSCTWNRSFCHHMSEFCQHSELPANFSVIQILFTYGQNLQCIKSVDLINKHVLRDNLKTKHEGNISQVLLQVDACTSQKASVKGSSNP